MQAPICRVCGMRHWGGEHIFPGSAKAKAAERAPKPANQVALSGPLPDEQSLAPRESPSVTGTKSEMVPVKRSAGETHQTPPWIFPTIDTAVMPNQDIEVQRIPDAVAVDAMVLGTGFTKVTTDGVEHIPYEQVQPVTVRTVRCPRRDGTECETPNSCAGGISCRFGPDIEGHERQPTPPPAVSLFDEDAVAHASDDPTAALTDAGKTDRKTYLREYMRARRQREREEKQRAAEAGTGATDQ